MDDILKIIGECEQRGVCDNDTVHRLVRLVKAIDDYRSSILDRRYLFNVLREELMGDPLSDLAILVVRELCNEKALEEIEEWAKDPEPRIRLAYLKCIAKLYDEGKVSIEELLSFKDDPSPRVREALVFSLSKNASRDEVFSLLSSMLRTERRSSVRSDILMALSSAIGEDRDKGRKVGFWRGLKRRSSRKE